MGLLQSTRRAADRMVCKARHVVEGVELRCGLIDHGGGMHCDVQRGLWWMAVG
jgi:hypothetical protein